MIIPLRLRKAASKAARRFCKTCYFLVGPEGKSFIDCYSTVTAAKRAGMSVCDYLEGLELDARKKGRRDRIVERLHCLGILKDFTRVCEIGPGTGRFMERILEIAHPQVYDIFETDIGWRDYLKEKHHDTNYCQVNAHDADGISLTSIPHNSCGLVHAHAVFVYLPLLHVVQYIKEMVRVSNLDGYIVFDFFPAESFDLATTEKWLNGSHHWPVVIPRIMLVELMNSMGCIKVASFSEIYGESQTEYLIFVKSHPDTTA